MLERIAQRRRENAEKKAREEEEQMAKYAVFLLFPFLSFVFFFPPPFSLCVIAPCSISRYAREEEEQRKASEALALSIAQRKRDLAEKKAREV